MSWAELFSWPNPAGSIKPAHSGGPCSFGLDSPPLIGPDHPEFALPPLLLLKLSEHVIWGLVIFVQVEVCSELHAPRCVQGSRGAQGQEEGGKPCACGPLHGSPRALPCQLLAAQKQTAMACPCTGTPLGALAVAQWVRAGALSLFAKFSRARSPLRLSATRGAASLRQIYRC